MTGAATGTTAAHATMPDIAGRTALIEAARAGDGPAIRALLAVCQPDIRRYARRNCRSDDVDDAVQDALLILQRRIGSLRVVAAFSTWLFEIVKRECLRQARAAMRFVTPGERVVTDAIDASYWQRPAADIQVEITAALQSLPEHYRQVILKRDIEELTIDEIAAALDLTREAAKARLHRARAMMREYLKD